MGHKGLADESADQQSSYIILSYQGDDLPSQYRSLIFSKWLRSLRFGNDYFRLIDSDSYFTAYNNYIDSLLTKATTRLAVLSDDLDVVLGFSVSRKNILDYVHVHKDQRHQGIAKELVPLQIDTATHLTKDALKIWPKYSHIKFNPFC